MWIPRSLSAADERARQADLGARGEPGLGRARLDDDRLHLDIQLAWAAQLSETSHYFRHEHRPGWPPAVALLRYLLALLLQAYRTILAVFVTSRLLRLGVQKNTIHSDLPKKHPTLSCERLQISARAEDDELFPACESRRNELFLRESPA